MCALSRYLVIGWLTGLLVSSVTGSDALAWGAALVAVVATYLLFRRFPVLGGCATDVAPPDGTEDSAAVDLGLGPVRQPDLRSLRGSPRDGDMATATARAPMGGRAADDER